MGWGETFPEFVYAGERRNEHQQLWPFMHHDVSVVVSISADSGQTDARNNRHQREQWTVQ